MLRSTPLVFAALFAMIPLQACSTSWDGWDEKGGGYNVPRDHYGNPILNPCQDQDEPCAPTTKNPPDK